MLGISDKRTLVRARSDSFAEVSVLNWAAELVLSGNRIVLSVVRRRVLVLVDWLVVLVFPLSVSFVLFRVLILVVLSARNCGDEDEGEGSHDRNC